MEFLPMGGPEAPAQEGCKLEASYFYGAPTVACMRLCSRMGALNALRGLLDSAALRGTKYLSYPSDRF